MEINYNFTNFNEGHKVVERLHILISNFKLIHDSIYLNYNIIKNDHFIANNLFITTTKAVKSYARSSSAEK
jgi:hypothetical protein